MHNLHFAVVKATDGQAACSIVEGDIESWGDENNWRAIGGAVSEDDEIETYDNNARWKPIMLNEDNEEESWTWAEIQARVVTWSTVPEEWNLEGAMVAAASLIAGVPIAQQEWSHLYRAMEYFRWAKEAREVADGFDLRVDSFFGMSLSDNGCTRMEWADEKVGGTKYWAVFIDMHE